MSVTYQGVDANIIITSFIEIAAPIIVILKINVFY